MSNSTTEIGTMICNGEERKAVAALLELLKASGGNSVHAAIAAGVHHATLKRWITNLENRGFAVRKPLEKIRKARSATSSKPIEGLVTRRHPTTEIGTMIRNGECKKAAIKLIGLLNKYDGNAVHTSNGIGVHHVTVMRWITTLENQGFAVRKHLEKIRKSAKDAALVE